MDECPACHAERDPGALVCATCGTAPSDGAASHGDEPDFARERAGRRRLWIALLVALVLTVVIAGALLTVCRHGV